MGKKEKTDVKMSNTVDLAKEIVRQRDKEHKKYNMIASELGLSESKVIILAKAFDKAMES